MQREQDYNMEDRNNLDTSRTNDLENESTASRSDESDSILDAPVSRMDGQTPFGNVSDNYISPGGDEDDDDEDDDDDDFDEDDDVPVEKEEVVDADPDVEDLDDDDLLLDDDDEDEDEDDTL